MFAKLKLGISATDVGHEFNVNESTIRLVRPKEEAIPKTDNDSITEYA